MTSLENLALACVSCSLRKGARTTAIDPAAGDTAQLFHPRLHAWSDHFIADVSGEIFGLTAIGRATITSLSMISSATRRVRRKAIEASLPAVMGAFHLGAIVDETRSAPELIESNNASPAL